MNDSKFDNVFEYKKKTLDEKVDFFLETLSPVYKEADYWVDFKTAKENIEKYEVDLNTLGYLIGKNVDEIEQFFRKYPDLIKLFPVLLGIREKSMVNQKLQVQLENRNLELDFKTIDQNNLIDYFDFMNNSGLTNLFQQGIQRSLVDYSLGIESGLNSNARKNRSGKIGEKLLEDALKELADKYGYLWLTQATVKKIFANFNEQIEAEFSNKRFDGALYNPEKFKIIIFEINLFSNGGSKSKAVSGEFQKLEDRFAKTNHDFIYITDGYGWLEDKSHLRETIHSIGNVFNLNMIKHGYIDDLIK